MLWYVVVMIFNFLSFFLFWINVLVFAFHVLLSYIFWLIIKSIISIIIIIRIFKFLARLCRRFTWISIFVIRRSIIIIIIRLNLIINNLFLFLLFGLRFRHWRYRLIVSSQGTPSSHSCWFWLIIMIVINVICISIS